MLSYRIVSYNQEHLSNESNYKFSVKPSQKVDSVKNKRPNTLIPFPNYLFREREKNKIQFFRQTISDNKRNLNKINCNRNCFENYTLIRRAVKQ